MSILRRTFLNLTINLLLKIPEILPVFYSFEFLIADKIKNFYFTQFDIFIQLIMINMGLEGLIDSVCNFMFTLSILNNYYFYFISNRYLKTVFFQKYFH